MGRPRRRSNGNPWSGPSRRCRIPPQTSLETSADVMSAREVARSAASLSDLRALLETFDGCGLKKTASRLCLSRGSPDARLMLIGEAPGKDEDIQGEPFVGRAGQLLDRMLAAIDLTEADVYITNLVFWRPPGNRTPSPEEVQVCQPFVERQIELLNPKVLVFLGNASAKQLTGATEGIMKLRGQMADLPARERHPRHGDAAPRLPPSHAHREAACLARPARHPRRARGLIRRTTRKNLIR